MGGKPGDNGGTERDECRVMVNGTDAEKGECEGPRVSFGFSKRELETLANTVALWEQKQDCSRSNSEGVRR